jgi:hypothetical protein
MTADLTAAREAGRRAAERVGPISDARVIARVAALLRNNPSNATNRNPRQAAVIDPGGPSPDVLSGV